MGDFRSFQRRTKKEEKTEEKQGAEDVKRKVEEYSKKSEGELWEELLARYAAGLADGSMDFAKLSSFADQVRPFLSPEQKEKLESVLARLKEG